jgi:hypothetical protein
MSNQDNITEQPTYSIEFGMQIADYMRENGCDVDTAIAACKKANSRQLRLDLIADLRTALDIAIRNKSKLVGALIGQIQDLQRKVDNA